ncbi:bifunctional DNA primase/polymerase-like protein [Brevibacillus sp. AG162]|uniref:bifunctional DNA primase/polymerase n=1 Tax=Brevibacillus sp. AG162 TaxID=2572910 RepID=UPI001151D809|nr:bifunctional DNA primase/polymerase [Brevibacillus sp. AG162]TQK53306.1 bifunctional DNA primase/polymerase-like protein [Brevibacillus sp. AG162]
MDQNIFEDDISNNNKTTNYEPDNSNSTLQSYATWYAEQNFPIIPLCPHDHVGMSDHHISVCSKPGKTPLLKGWSQREVPSLEEIEKWHRYWPKANIGLILGSISGLVAVDVDGEFGELTLDDWSQGDLPLTWEFTTPGGGRRLIFAIPEGITLTKHSQVDRSKNHEECALLGEGQQTVVPPSIHQNGGSYEWVEGRALWDIECAQAPEWLIQKMTKKQTSANKSTGQQDRVEIDAIQTLSDKCPMFQQALQTQNETGLSEEEWFLWVTLLVKAGHSEDALLFSKTSNKHDERSYNRVAELKCSGNETYGPTRCSTFGCDESQIRRCFGKISTNKHNEITNSPALFFKQKTEESTSRGVEKWIEIAKKTKYQIDEHGNLCVISFKKDGSQKRTPIANFLARATKQVCKDDGEERKMHYELEGVILSNQQKLSPILVPTVDFPGMTWLHQWGLAPNIEPGQLAKDQVRHAIQSFSQDITEEKVYTHLGWRKVNDKWCYLHAGGCIGVGDVKVEIDHRLSRYKLPEKVDDPIAAMKASLSLLDPAPKKVTLPLFALSFLAPLCEWLRSMDLEPAFIIWLHGETGSRKSSLAALFLCHFGIFSTKTPPASFKDTMNSLEKRTFECKDSILLVDDYHPASNPQEAKKMEQIAQQLMRSYGDRVSRGRMRQDTSLRRDYPPRGWLS